MIDYILNMQEGFALYLVVFALLMGGAFFLPFPEDLVLILTGVLIHREMVNPYIMIAVVYGAILLGDLFLYALGYFFGMSLFKKRWFRNRIHPSKIRKAQVHLDKNNILTVFVARHLFYLRSITFVTCGAVKMNFFKFLFADAIAAIISTPIMIGIGYLASENFEVIRKNMRILELGAGILMGAVIIWYFARHRKKPATESDLSSKEENL